MDKLEILKELSLDLNWTWNREIDRVWEALNKEVWERTRNPCVVLQLVSQEKLNQLFDDPSFCQLLSQVMAGRKEEMEAPTWFDQYRSSDLSTIAYFSMEFMLNEALPIYSGGLGNVAGDQLKAAHDLGVPVVGVGLLYQQGYFRQLITKEGNQQALYPFNDPDQLPIQPVRNAKGEWVRIEIGFPGWSVWLRAWEAKIGRIKLYLLDSNDPYNFPVHRGLTSELYGGDSELRLKQELVLGIGGWRLLRTLGINPTVCHLNEGHAAFAVLERARDFMNENNLSFKEALVATRAGNVFTTHTAVPAGFDRFSPALMKQYLSHYAELIHLPLEELLGMGRVNSRDSEEFFNMAYLAIRGSCAVNGVSKLHGKVSQHIFEPLFPRWPVEEIPVGYVTNGVHMPSWESPAADRLWTEICGKFRWLESDEEHEKDIAKASDKRLWQMRNEAREGLINYAREKVAIQMEARGSSQDEIALARTLFNPHTLTLGFARRFATYKRPNLLLHDKERLIRLLTTRERPVQLIIAGKAHPADLPGQAMIREWIEFISANKMHGHVLFLSDYDMYVTEELVRGVDVWVNTPRRPWEACGTSGMKVLVNGGLNLSELDGWWAEAYTPEVGWALGDGKEHGVDPAWDATEADALYELLEKEIIPDFYTRNQEGLSVQWMKKVRASLTKLTPHFAASRAVKDYTEKFYLPAAKLYQTRCASGGMIAKKMANLEQTLQANWGRIQFEKISEDLGKWQVEVMSPSLTSQEIKVELYANNTPGEIHVMQSENNNLYTVQIATTRPKTDYTVRITPQQRGLLIPLELPLILWQH